MNMMVPFLLFLIIWISFVCMLDLSLVEQPSACRWINPMLPSWRPCATWVMFEHAVLPCFIEVVFDYLSLKLSIGPSS